MDVGEILYQYPGSSYQITPLSSLFGVERLCNPPADSSSKSANDPRSSTCGYFTIFKIGRKKDNMYIHCREEACIVIHYKSNKSA